MSKSQLGLILGGITLVLILYQLPRVVVENDTLVEPETSSHTFAIPQEVRAQIDQLRINWKNSEDTEKKFNFADSLATTYLNYQILDSALWFVEQLKTADSERWNWRVAELTFAAFQRAGNPEETKELGILAGEEIKNLLIEYPENSSLKNKLAMTLVVTENPMAGIQMLRDILANDPSNTETIRNLGILSIQSGQFDKAESRFRDLLKIDSTDEEAMFYMGMSQIEQGNQAGFAIMQRLSSSENPAIKSLAIEYLEN